MCFIGLSEAWQLLVDRMHFSQMHLTGPQSYARGVHALEHEEMPSVKSTLEPRKTSARWTSMR